VHSTSKELPRDTAQESAPECTQAPGAAFPNHRYKHAPTSSGCSQLWNRHKHCNSSAGSGFSKTSTMLETSVLCSVPLLESHPYRCRQAAQNSRKGNGFCGSISLTSLGWSLQRRETATDKSSRAREPELTSSTHSLRVTSPAGN